MLRKLSSFFNFFFDLIICKTLYRGITRSSKLFINRRGLETNTFLSNFATIVKNAIPNFIFSSERA
ncbi:hypothetical protein QQP08_000539 [Theobroma cacao]|nr:hypothetical protein QQP08_000539 [Theobroma cacao]